MKTKCILMSAIISLIASSCGLKSYIARYSVSLASVESPADAKQSFGDTKIVTLNDDNINKYRYEDDFIEITWVVSSKEFTFVLKNKSEHTLKINWDDISYVNTNGEVGRVMHNGVKYSERNSSQPSTSIPRGATISDLLLPTDNVYYSQYGGWSEKYLIPCVYNKQEDKKSFAPLLINKTMSIMMPIMIENIQNDYVFIFNIDKLLN